MLKHTIRMAAVLGIRVMSIKKEGLPPLFLSII
jgi:hypothetical protein